MSQPPSRTPIVAGNWKMHGSRAANDELLLAVRSMADRTPAVDVVVCVPFPYLAQASVVLHGGRAAWGAQTCSEHAQGAYTGEVSGAMIAESGARYVIVGHSERRALFGETDAQVAAKFVAAQKAGLVPILCVGETLAEREAGQTEAVVLRQLAAVTAAAGAKSLGDAVVAYEPVWAIGTGRTATPAEAQAVHATLRQAVARDDAATAAGLRLLYGGSVKAGNAKELFAMPDIDGGLIGGASLVAADFGAIVAAAAG